MGRKLQSILALLCVSASCVFAADSPNVILVMCDDLGWGDVGFNGGKIINRVSPRIPSERVDRAQR